MTSSHCTILAPIYIADRFHKIADKCMSDNTAVRITKDAIWDSKSIAVWNEFWLKNIGNDLQPMKEQDTGQWEVRGGVADHNINVILCYFLFNSRVRLVVKQFHQTELLAILPTEKSCSVKITVIRQLWNCAVWTWQYIYTTNQQFGHTLSVFSFFRKNALF